MKIVVVGDGKVGFLLAKLLAQEGHDVVIIDRDAPALRDSQDKIDVAIVSGNGVSPNVQRDAGVPDSDLLISVTGSDEVNILCCTVARTLGCKGIVARVRNPEYDREIGMFKRDFGLALVINPEKAAALEIFRLLQYPPFVRREAFAGGRVEMVSIRLDEKEKMVGSRLDSLGWGAVQALVCAVERNGSVTIPSGSFRLEAGDKVTFACATGDLHSLLQSFSIEAPKMKRVMLIGGSMISIYLAGLLLRVGIGVTLIEPNGQRCEELYDQLPEATIIHGDPSIQSVLLDEGIRDTDAVIALTGMDEENLIIAMFANRLGVPKSIAKVDRIEYAESMAETMGVDTVVNPKLLCANEIVRYARAVSASGAGSVETLYRIADGRAEALGFTVPDKGAYLGIPLSKLAIKPNILIASIVHNGVVHIPKGSDVMQSGDSVIVAAAENQPINALSDIFLSDEVQGK